MADVKLTINLNELKDKLKPTIGGVDSIEAIGNHHLKRHLVYKLSCGDKKYVIKLYYKKNKWNREVASLKLFENSQLLAPKIMDYGIFDDGMEWLIYKFIEGQLLSDVYKNISSNNLKEIYFEMGRQLGMIHYQKEFKFYGSMDEYGNSIDGFTRYREYFEDLVDTMLSKLYSFEHENFELIKQAEKKLKSMYYILNEVDKPTLCHNDFCPRNTLVDEYNGQYYLKAIIDFEQCIPTNKDEELIQVYMPLIESNQALAGSFKLGYEELGKIDYSKLSLKKDFYNLRKGLEICSWSKEVDYSYYLKGIKLLEETMENHLNGDGMNPYQKDINLNKS